jgi:hypothetical protein
VATLLPLALLHKENKTVKNILEMFTDRVMTQRKWKLPLPASRAVTTQRNKYINMILFIRDQFNDDFNF